MITESILKGIGIGLAGLLATFIVIWWRKNQAMKQKARAFDLEISEKQVKENIDAMNMDTLIDEANKKWPTKKD